MAMHMYIFLSPIISFYKISNQKSKNYFIIINFDEILYKGERERSLK